MKRISRPLIVLILIFLIAFLAAIFIDSSAIVSYLWAALLIIISAIGGLAPFKFVTEGREINTILFSIAARLLIMLSGSLCILLLAKINVLFFILWLMILYPATIIVEVMLVVSFLKKK